MRAGTLIPVFLLSFCLAQVGLADSNSCSREQDYREHATPQAASKIIFDASCFVEHVDTLHPALVVDTRSSTAYRRLHLKGSINIPAEQLVGKREFSGQKLLLVGESQSRFPAGQLCGRLRKAGFARISILLGGIRAAIEQGKPGNRPVGFGELDSIDAREMLAELLQDQISLVAISQSSARLHPQLQNQFVDILDLTDAKETRRDLYKRSADWRYPLVLVGTTAEYRRIQRLFKTGIPGNLYFVDGGNSALNRYLKAHRKIQIAMSSVPNRYKCL